MLLEYFSFCINILRKYQFCQKLLGVLVTLKLDVTYLNRCITIRSPKSADHSSFKTIDGSWRNNMDKEFFRGTQNLDKQTNT